LAGQVQSFLRQIIEGDAQIDQKLSLKLGELAIVVNSLRTQISATVDSSIEFRNSVDARFCDLERAIHHSRFSASPISQLSVLPADLQSNISNAYNQAQNAMSMVQKLEERVPLLHAERQENSADMAKSNFQLQELSRETTRFSSETSGQMAFLKRQLHELRQLDSLRAQALSALEQKVSALQLNSVSHPPVSDPNLLSRISLIEDRVSKTEFFLSSLENKLSTLVPGTQSEIIPPCPPTSVPLSSAHPSNVAFSFSTPDAHILSPVTVCQRLPGDVARDSALATRLPGLAPPSS
jgi:chromosome segregation ATPase